MTKILIEFFICLGIGVITNFIFSEVIIYKRIIIFFLCYGMFFLINYLKNVRHDLTIEVEKLEEMISDILNGVDVIKNSELEDTLFSRLRNKMFDLYDITINQKHRIMEEKKRIEMLIADISHQVKTPLTNIRINNELLCLTDVSNSEQKILLKQMECQVNRLNNLLDNLLKMSRLENRAIVLNRNLFFLQETLLIVEDHVIYKAHERKITICINCSKEYLVEYDERWIIEALVNIVENAIKYSKEGECIKISVEVLEQFFRIDIEDQGLGISKDDKNIIFERFYRGKNVRGLEGSGLGLYIARNIIEAHGGSIKVISKLSKGSRFSVYLQKAK